MNLAEHVVISSGLDALGVRPEVFLFAGTRPEAIKLAPLVNAFNEVGRMKPVLVASGQHPTMVQQALAAFDLKPEVTLSLDRRRGSIAELAVELLGRFDELIAHRSPGAVVVQGDTTTALMAAQAAFWRRIPVVHLEAGLRSHDLASPFPEEANRKLIAQIAALHLAPTTAAAANLATENQSALDIATIGNTVVDAVLDVAARPSRCEDPVVRAVLQRAAAGASRLVLVTAHRRESWGEPLEHVLQAVAELVEAHSDIEVVLPMHPNPAVREQVQRNLDSAPRVTLTDPLPYDQLAHLLSVSTLVLSDSGGIQEEAPSFAVPVLVLRDVTEREEAIEAGCAVLVGTDAKLIVSTASRLLADETARRAMTAAGNPFGDGHAAGRAERSIATLLDIEPGRS